MTLIRRLAAGAIVGPLAALAVQVGDAPAAAPAAGAHVLGASTAPVTVIEYASVGCPHCAEWANDVFPAFKKAYIDTGKVRFEFHEMITGDSELAVAGFLIADCAPADRYFQVVDAIFADQQGVAEGGGVALLKIAQAAGVTPARFDACLTSAQGLADLQARTEADAKAHGVLATPTFFVNGVRFDGNPSLEALGAAVVRARPAPPHG